MSLRVWSYFTWVATFAAVAAVLFHDSTQGSAITVVNVLLLLAATMFGVLTLVLSKRLKNRNFLDIVVLVTAILVTVFGLVIIALLALMIMVGGIVGFLD
jgi:hypothetical protein